MSKLLVAIFALAIFVVFLIFKSLENMSSSQLYQQQVQPEPTLHEPLQKFSQHNTNLCTLEQLGVGTWNHSVVRPAPYCCFQNSRQMGCTPHPSITKRMRRNQGCGNGCNCDMDAQYGPVWVPSANCRLDAWDSPKFCERLGNKRLVFIGDSLADQFHLVVFNMLHEEKRSFSETCVDQVIFRASDTFHFFSHDRGDPLDKIIASETQLAAQFGQQPTFIVCIGPHLYRSRKPNSGAGLVANYSNLIQYAQFQFELNHVPFRFIPLTPVHSCNLRRNTTMVWNNVTGQYHYPHIPAMKQELYRLLPNELILPVYDALDQRPEAHNWSDCLHFCMPGALQILPIFLSHLLVIGKL